MDVFSPFFELHKQIDVTCNMLRLAYKTAKNPKTGNTKPILKDRFVRLKVLYYFIYFFHRV